MYLRAPTLAFSTFVINVHAHADTIRTEIERKEESWVSALASGDIATLTSMYEEHAWFIVPGAEPFKGREAIRGALAGLKVNTPRMTLKTFTVEKIAKDYLIENGVAGTLAPSPGTSANQYAQLSSAMASDGKR